MRVRTHIQQKERRRLVLSDFKGVDFSSSPFRVSQSRATDMRNLINEYGVNHKRHGWREIRNFKPYDGEGSYVINGIFDYRHGSHSVLIIHVGRKLYRVDARGGINTDITGYECISEGFLLEDARSQAFYSGGRLYIVGVGDYLVYGSWDGGESYELRQVYGDEDTYVPTTTISIDNDDNEADTARATLDKVNLLTPFRINQLLGSSLIDKDEEGNEVTVTERSWTLDSGHIDEGTAVEIRLETLNADGEAVTVEILNSGSDKTKLYVTSGTGDAVGAVDYEKGRITLTIDTSPQVEGADNIFVKFSAGGEGGVAVRGCSFGVLFGADGNTDRLFLSGNKDMPNVDIYSEAEDYTYFPDRNYCTVGSDASAITGYIRLADSTLVIFKEEYMNEPSLFYRTGTTKIEYDSAGVVSDVYGIFPIVAGSVGETLICRHALANFGDDALMLSQNGVNGIVLGENSRTTERYTRERSRPINEKLKHNNLAGATAIVYQNKYFLAVDDACYVADGRFTFRGSDSLDGAFNYEWWYWDNIPAHIFAVLDGELYFGTTDGRLCRFDEEYTDRTYQTLSAGDIAYDTENGTLVYREGIELRENDRIRMEDAFYVIFQEGCKAMNGQISFPAEMSDLIYNGLAVYAEDVDGTELARGVEYLITEVDKDSLTYRLADGDGNIVEMADSGEGVSFTLCRNLSDTELYITQVDERDVGEFSVKELREGEALKLVPGEYNAVPQPRAMVTYHKNVVAEWYSQIMDLGTNDQSKTLLKISISTEPEINGNISFGYETRAVSRLIGAKGVQSVNSFSFDNLSFESFTFDSGYASSYTVRVNERNFNFIIFRFISEEDSDCAVNDITLTYKINRSNIGVR